MDRNCNWLVNWRNRSPLGLGELLCKTARPCSRFTIRDVLCLTVAVAFACGCFVTSRNLALAMSTQCDAAWQRVVRMEAPLVGGESVPPEW